MTDLVEIFGAIIIGTLAAMLVLGFIGIATVIVHAIKERI